MLHSFHFNYMSELILNKNDTIIHFIRCDEVRFMTMKTYQGFSSRVKTLSNAGILLIIFGSILAKFA
jgi:hypothetical protein